MNTDAIKRFLMFLTSAAKVERGQLYQLVQSAEISYLWRDVESQRDIGLTLQSFAYPFNQVGKYYESVYLLRTGQHQRAKQLLDSIAESAPAQYRSRALLSLSAVEESLGQFEESLRLRLQASTCDEPVTSLEAQWGMAILRSLEGGHQAALRDLERMMPLAHIIGKRGHPAYTKFLNGYALELFKSNRTQEAEQAADIIAASPFISRYPEWQETVAEIAAKRKRSSTIAVPRETAPQEPRVLAAIEFMHKNLHEKILVLDIARAVGMSQPHFFRVFTSETGIAPGQYLINLRMKKAGELLSTRFLSIKEVMTATGYNSRGDFIRFFKSYFQTTPTAYKKRFRHRKAPRRR